MSKRSYQLRITISNGITYTYRLRPLVGTELPSPFIAGFRLARIERKPGDDGSDLYDLKISPAGCECSPVYFVRLAQDGAVNCSCPQWQKTETCKHADALTAAELLPVALAQLLYARTKLLDAAEARAASLQNQWNNLPEAIEDPEPPPKKSWGRRRN